MPLESLLELVQTLSSRIDRHGPALRQSEALTRYALIDPLLRGLGWDTSDPGMVIPEYRSGNGRADYALMKDGSPTMMLEAKSLDTPLQDTGLAQGINYCLMQGTSFFCVSDGRQWEIYETHKPVPIDEKQIVSFNLKNMSVSEVCLKALALWRPGVESGQVSVAQTPIVELPKPQQSTSETEIPIIQPEPLVPMPENGEWQSLSEFNLEKGSPLPSEIQFPDGTKVQTPRLRSIIIEVARWLMNNNLLNPSHCPVQLPNSHTRYVVNTEPYHQSGKEFHTHEQISSLYIYTHGNRFGIVRRTREFIKHMGQDPTQFKVRIS